ncbi:uncharacterized protein C19orf44 homolog [Vanacampus margaritifer]
MWRQGGTSDALERAQALLAAKSNKNQNNNNRAAVVVNADGKSLLAPPSGSDVSLDMDDLSPLNSSREGRDVAPSRSPSRSPPRSPAEDAPAGGDGGGGRRFLKKPAPPMSPGSHDLRAQPSSKPGSQASALKKLAQIENRVHSHQREPEPRNPTPRSDRSSASRPRGRAPALSSSRSGSPGMRKKTRGSPEDPRGGSSPPPKSVDSDEEEVMKLVGEHNLSRSSSRTRAGPMFSRRSPRSAPPPARPPSGDALSSSAPIASLERGSPSPTHPSDSSRSAPEEVLSLFCRFSLFPLGCDASQADFCVNVKTLEDVGSAPLEDAGGETAEEQTQVPDERDGVSDCAADYESDFESVGGMETGWHGNSGQVSEHLLGHEEEEEAGGLSALVREHHSSKARTESEDATSPPSSLSSASSSASSLASRRQTPRARSLGRTSSSSSSPSAGERFKDAAAQTDVCWPRGSSAPAPSLPLTDQLKRRLAVTRSFVISSRRKRDGVIDSLGPPAYTYTTLRQTMDVISKTKAARMSDART